jgi:hypothetical protein
MARTFLGKLHGHPELPRDTSLSDAAVIRTSGSCARSRPFPQAATIAVGRSRCASRSASPFTGTLPCSTGR